MKIKRLEIYGYGKWVDQSFDLNDGLQIFLGENEAGKSTLMSFIHSVLFGFPTRNSTLLRYEPLESSRYGGKIIGEDAQLGEVIIERTHGKVTGDVTVTLEDGSTGSDDLLARILKGIDRENYQNIFSFSLTDIENVHQLDKNKLSRYLLNIGAHSTDYYLDLVDDFQKSAYDLYRPSGRIPPLNKELAIIKKQEKQLKKIEARNASYLDLIAQRNQEDEELKNLEKKKEKIRQDLTDLEALGKDLHLLEEIQQLKKEINQTQLPLLKKDGLYLLEENKKKQAELSDRLNTIAYSITRLKNNLLSVDKIENYQAHEQAIKELEASLPDKIEEFEALKQTEAQWQIKEAKKHDLKKELKLAEDHAEIPVFTKDQHQEIKQWLSAHEQLQEKIERQNQQLTLLDAKIQQKNEQADYYEELMWDSDYLNQVEKRIKNQAQTQAPIENKVSQGGPILTGFLGLGLVAASFFISSINPLVLATLGSFFILLSVVYYQRNKKQVKESSQTFISDDILVKEYNKQQTIQSDWQNLLAEIDAIQRDYQRNKKELENKVSLKNDYHRKWRKLLASQQIPPVHPIENGEKLAQNLTQLSALEVTIQELANKKQGLTQKLETDFTVLEKILPQANHWTLTEKIHYFRQYLREINQLLNSEQKKMTKLETQIQTEQNLLNEQEKLKLERKHLLDAAGVDSEEKFYLLYDKQRELEKKKDRLRFLSENTPGFDENKKLPTKIELSNQQAKLKERLKQLETESRQKIDERAKTKVTIQNLEKDGRYAEALQSFENKKARIQNLVDDWLTDKLAAAMIQSTLNQVTSERFKEIMTEINHYFSYLTNQRYSKILFKEDELFVQDQQGRVIEVKTLSRGTAEPLYVAIRLAYIIKMHDVIKLPIIMDDPFVNFDKARKERMHQLLGQLSDQLQIIYFSYDSSLTDTFAQAEVIDLEK